jgi:hypothetical protein
MLRIIWDPSDPTDTGFAYRDSVCSGPIGPSVDTPDGWPVEAVLGWLAEARPSHAPACDDVDAWEPQDDGWVYRGNV